MILASQFLAIVHGRTTDAPSCCRGHKLDRAVFILVRSYYRSLENLRLDSLVRRSRALAAANCSTSDVLSRQKRQKKSCCNADERKTTRRRDVDDASDNR